MYESCKEKRRAVCNDVVKDIKYVPGDGEGSISSVYHIGKEIVDNKCVF